MDTSHKIYPWHVVAATPAEIAKLTTRHLKALHQEWRVVGLSVREWETPDKHTQMYIDACKILVEELARRPHVPNKAEGKALRRAAAKRGR